MPDQISIEEYEHVFHCGREVDCNADLERGTISLRKGLTPTQYLKLGMQIGREMQVPRASSIIPMVGKVD